MQTAIEQNLDGSMPILPVPVVSGHWYLEIYPTEPPQNTTSNIRALAYDLDRGRLVFHC